MFHILIRQHQSALYDKVPSQVNKRKCSQVFPSFFFPSLKVSAPFPWNERRKRVLVFGMHKNGLRQNFLGLVPKEKNILSQCAKWFRCPSNKNPLVDFFVSYFRVSLRAWFWHKRVRTDRQKKRGGNKEKVDAGAIWRESQKLRYFHWRNNWPLASNTD